MHRPLPASHCFPKCDRVSVTLVQSLDFQFSLDTGTSRTVAVDFPAVIPRKDYIVTIAELTVRVHALGVRPPKSTGRPLIDMA